MMSKYMIFDIFYAPKIVKVIFIIAVILVSSFIFFYYKYIDQTWDQCKESTEIKKMEFCGIVTGKVYYKESIAQQYLKITDNTKGKFTLSLEYEILKLVKTGNSITWELINIGDSVKKEPNTFIISYKNPKSKNWESRELAFPDCTE
ncbi:MAG: hypothetical protein K9J13_01720 [Saprospiraceae bacterium]|nr:hypothetical protein [Saprospiraceae bacterium]